MSCLTRKLQQRLASYILSHQRKYQERSSRWIKADLVKRGLCPSYVTLDQFEALLQSCQQLGKPKKRLFSLFA